MRSMYSIKSEVRRVLKSQEITDREKIISIHKLIVEAFDEDQSSRVLPLAASGHITCLMPHHNIDFFGLNECIKIFKVLKETISLNAKTIGSESNCTIDELRYVASRISKHQAINDEKGNHIIVDIYSDSLGNDEHFLIINIETMQYYGAAKLFTYELGASNIWFIKGTNAMLSKEEFDRFMAENFQ